MSTEKLGIIGGLVVVSIAVPAILLYRSQVALHDQNAAMRQQLTQLSRISADNHRLSDLATQAKVAQASANERLQELLTLRTEVNRLKQESHDSNQISQALLVQSASEQLEELAKLRNEVADLSDAISEMREEMQEIPAAIPTTPVAPAANPASARATQEPVAPAPRTAEDQTVGIRMIETHGDTFADKLKRSVDAQEGETFPEVFGRFLQINGVDTSTIAGLAFNERTGRVIARAVPTTLDQIERLTLALDQAQ